MIRPQLFGSTRDNRLLYRMASDFGYTSTTEAKIDTRDLASQTQAQQQSNLDAQRQQQSTVDALNATSTATNYYRTAGTADVGTGIAGQTTTLGRDGNPVSSPVKLDSYVTMDRSLPTQNYGYTDPRNPTGYIPPGATQDTDATTRAARLIDEKYRQQAANGMTVDPAVIAAEKEAEYARINSEDDIETRRQQKENSRSADAAAGDKAARDQSSPGTKKALGSLEIALAGLPPEDAAAIRAGMEANLAALDQERGAENRNYMEEVDAADDSMGAYGKIIDQMRSDAKALYDESKGFVDENQERREKTAAAEKANLLEQMKSEEMRQDRKMRQDLEKRKNTLLMGQAVGGGFGSSNWTTDIAEAEWDGEQAINEMHEEFGFKNVDVEIAFQNTMDGIYEFYGTQKMDAFKGYKADLMDANQKKFAATETTDNRKIEAKKTFNLNLARIAKEQAGEIAGAAKAVRDTMASQRKEQTDKQDKLWVRLREQRAQDGNTNPGLTSQIIREMNEAGIDTTGIDPHAATLAQVNEAYRRSTDQRDYDFKVSEAGKKAVGRSLVPTQVSTITDYEKSISELTDLKSDFVDANGTPIYGKTGPVSGLRSINPFDTEAQVLKAKIKKVKQIVGKAMEGGVLRKEDEAKYNAILANMYDTPEVAGAKIDELINDMTSGREIYLNTLEDSGYNVENIRNRSRDPLAKPTINSLPNDEADVLIDQILNGALDGVLPPSLDFDPANLQSSNIGGRTIKAQPYVVAALQKADQDFFQQTGQHIQVNESFRDTSRQAALYAKSKRGEIGRAAPPGRSFHEKGLALDIGNWKEAAPYLKRYGLINGLKDDMGHFSIGEMNPDFIASLNNRA